MLKYGVYDIKELPLVFKHISICLELQTFTFYIRLPYQKQM